MNTTLATSRVQIQEPNGDVKLVTIEGGNAEDTARFIQNNYLRQAPAGEGAEQEAPLSCPGLGDADSAAAESNSPGTTLASNQEEVPEMPVMNFAKA